MVETFRAAFGRAVRARRLERGLSPEALAVRTGLHPAYLAGVERGERNLAFASLLRLARALDTPPSELLAGAERLAAWRADAVD